MTFPGQFCPWQNVFQGIPKPESPAACLAVALLWVIGRLQGIPELWVLELPILSAGRLAKGSQHSQPGKGFYQHKRLEGRNGKSTVICFRSVGSWQLVAHEQEITWGRGWMTKASGVGERRKGRGELRRDCHHRVAALFVPTRMQQWYIDIWYITMIYMGEGAGGALSREKSRDVLGEPRNTC